jgi:hypothetical protein
MINRKSGPPPQAVGFIEAGTDSKCPQAPTGHNGNTRGDAITKALMMFVGAPVAQLSHATFACGMSKDRLALWLRRYLPPQDAIVLVHLRK